MPIRKASAQDLFDEDRTYVTVPSDSIAALCNPDALAILVYLLDKPTDWIIREKEVCDKFQIGRRRYRAALTALKREGLLYSCRYRYEVSGKIAKHEYVLLASPEL
jgi:hypothetical protein